MTKNEQLENFIKRSEDFINSSYIVADIKIANLLKAIAISDTLLAIFKNCLTDFDYLAAQKKFLVKNKYLSEEKGQFVAPTNSRDLLAFVFNVLADVDSKRIDFADFISKYFYEDGSFSSGYAAFVERMIKPFAGAVVSIMTSVIDGKLQDPVEALTELEAVKDKKVKENERVKELLSESNAKKIKQIKAILLADKTKIKESNLSDGKKEDLFLVIDMLANVLDGDDKDAVKYAFTAYKYCVNARKLMLFGRAKKIEKLLKEVYNEL